MSETKHSAIVAVVGNPNCGKTTLFNALTGARQAVGNWAGVTVEKKTGRASHDGLALEIVDLPGTYCLSFGDAASEDERIARDYVASGEADVILNIVDASNLERNLYVTVQLLEMRVPMVVALNMMDAADAAGTEIDAAKLSARLGCPVVPMVASRGKGIRAALDALAGVIRNPAPAAARVAYPPAIEGAVNAAAALPGLIPADAKGSNADARFAALRAIEDVEGAARLLPPASFAALEGIVAAAEAELGDTLDILFADGRYGFIGGISADAVRQKGRATAAMTQKIDRVVLHRVFGLPIFLAVMYAMFLFTINIGGAFIDFFDQFFGTLFVDGVEHLLTDTGAPDWFVALAKSFGTGIQTVSTFIPVIGCLFLFLSFLEDSGYMARAAFVMDRVMRAIGLPGKAFVPLIVGFGCGVPAVMAARTLENPRDRILTAMMAPFMSCGARLPVYVLFAAAFFPENGQNIIFALYLIGIAAAIATGFMLKSTLLRGDTSPFIMELPPYHLPQVASLLLRAWDRLKVFVLRAGKMIASVVVILAMLNSWGTDGSFGNDDTDQSVLSAIGRTITPALAPMGVKEENWPAAVGMFTGIFAKEAVIGTLNALYAGVDIGDAAEAEEGAAEEADAGFDLWGNLAAAFATIPENLAGVVDSLADPLGLSVGDLTDAEAVAENNEVEVSTLTAMQTLFGSQAAAFAYLLAVLLYMPCVAAMGAIYRETGAGWATFAALWTTGIGYGAATVFYQAATFAEHPQSSGVAIGCVLAVLAAAVAAMRHLGAPGAARPGGSVAAC